MKILVIEDEQPNFLRLKKLLSEIDPKCTIDGPLVSQTAVREYFLQGYAPDIVISDIRLSDGLVFDAFDEMNVNTRIIFTTAYSEYAVKAFNYNSIHYLLKPIVREELAAAIDKALRQNPERLSEMFFRANRQYIVNINSIRKLVSFWDRKIKVVLTDFPEVEILVSRDKSKTLRQWLDQ